MCLHSDSRNHVIIIYAVCMNSNTNICIICMYTRLYKHIYMILLHDAFAEEWCLCHIALNASPCRGALIWPSSPWQQATGRDHGAMDDFMCSLAFTCGVHVWRSRVTFTYDIWKLQLLGISWCEESDAPIRSQADGAMPRAFTQVQHRHSTIVTIVYTMCRCKNTISRSSFIIFPDLEWQLQTNCW